MSMETPNLTDLNMVAPDACLEPVKFVVRTYILFNEKIGFAPCRLGRKNLTQASCALNSRSPTVQ